MWVCPNPQEVERLEAEPDVSRLPAFFSYAHFYVIYVRFWELDGDHDLVIDRDDLGRHGDRGEGGAGRGGSGERREGRVAVGLEGVSCQTTNSSPFPHSHFLPGD